MKDELFRTVTTPIADPATQEVVAGLVTLAQNPVSDAPLFAPQMAGGGEAVLGLGLIATPKEPKEPKEPKKV